MIETVPAQLRYVCTLAFGARLHTRSLDRLVTALLDAREEFGAVGRDAAEALRGPELDETARREVQIRRFRTQAKLAARTPYYGRLFAELGIEPRKLRWEDLEALPPTPKHALRSDPDAFVPATARPAFRALTTGTTGIPTSVYFSRDELEAATLLGAVGVLLGRQAEPTDVIQFSVSSRGLFPLMLAARISARIGAVMYQTGFVDPAHALALLAERRSLPGHKPQASLLSTTPSYLGSLVERGSELGYRPRDFGVERIMLGGEIATEGLRSRAARLFGEVEYIETYAATEILGTGALTCPSGHLHFPVPPGLVEVVRRCEAAKASFVFAPDSPAELYGTGFQTHVEPGPLAAPLCGARRPGHFRGVCTIVAKLFALSRADVALFGEKDYQQLLVIRRMAADLDIGTEVIGRPIVREPDGLALSSRNAYLTPEERPRATALWKAILAVRERFRAGERDAAALEALARQTLEKPGLRVDYAELRDPIDLQPARPPDPGTRLFLAAFVGKTRLIDNAALGE